ncbi:MAG: tRNA adenosine(34) deaminase TadA [Phycisphaerae bacterium]|nr:tRNA adenosine(34) deaminase TadA [Phycisphaerae bacterium]
MPTSDETFMLLALEQAKLAEQIDEVPIGCVIVCDGQVIGRGHNRRIVDSDPTAHAEMIAIRQAAAARGDWRLEDCELFVTLEPCPMCTGAAVLARIRRIVFGPTDPKAGACGTLMNLAADPRLNHRIEVTGGVLGDQCRLVLQSFFRRQRQMGKNG